MALRCIVQLPSSCLPACLPSSSGRSRLHARSRFPGLGLGTAITSLSFYLGAAAHLDIEYGVHVPAKRLLVHGLRGGARG